MAILFASTSSCAAASGQVLRDVTQFKCVQDGGGGAWEGIPVKARAGQFKTTVSLSAGGWFYVFKAVSFYFKCYSQESDGKLCTYEKFKVKGNRNFWMFTFAYLTMNRQLGYAASIYL